jgi:hypothetical protein
VEKRQTQSATATRRQAPNPMSRKIAKKVFLGKCRIFLDFSELFRDFINLSGKRNFPENQKFS